MKCLIDDALATVRLAAILGLICCSEPVQAQFIVAGQASAAFANGEAGLSQNTVDGGRPTFLWRGDLFADVILADDVALLTNFRILQDQELRVDLFALRVSDIASSGVSLQLGQVDIPVGSLGERRFPKQNPFYRLPLVNEHLTSLCSSDYKIWVLEPGFALRGDGVRILDLGLYDLGAKVYGSVGILDYTLVLINGMASATGTYGEGGVNNNSGLGTVVRLAVTPLAGLTIGASYGGGSFMGDQSTDSSSFLFGGDPDDYLQHVFGGDIDFAAEHFSFYAQAVYNIWKYSPDLRAFGYSAEAQYALTPRFSVAARVGGFVFEEISNVVVPTFMGPVTYSGKWDRDVLRTEISLRYRISRELMTKVVYEWNRMFQVADDPPDNLLLLQTVLGF